jgi:hypothetical protein
MTKRKDKKPAPARAPGPVTNKRLRHKPLKPARGRFVERSTLDGTLQDGPEDVTAFDAAPAPEDSDTGGADE